MKPYDKPIKKVVVTVLCMLAGNALLAFLVAAFILPHGIVMGGTTGIGIVLNSFFPGLDISIIVLVMNMGLLMIGAFVLGKKFAMTTLASTILYPVFLALIERIPGIGMLTDNSLMAAIFAGCLMGIALGLVIRVGSSTGGMDIVNLIFNHVFHAPVALFVWLTDLIVVGVQAIFAPPEKTLLGIIVLVLDSIILDKAMILGKAQTQLFVISQKYELIREHLLNQLNAGVTMTLIETGKLSEEQKGVLCVIPSRKLYDATRLIHDIDPHAFITVTQVKEVRGRGFTEERRNL